MKKKIFMSAALMLLLGGVSANAKAVDIDITTSCGAVHHISEIGDNDRYKAACSICRVHRVGILRLI